MVALTPVATVSVKPCGVNVFRDLLKGEVENRNIIVCPKTKSKWGSVPESCLQVTDLQGWKGRQTGDSLPC